MSPLDGSIAHVRAPLPRSTRRLARSGQRTGEELLNSLSPDLLRPRASSLLPWSPSAPPPPSAAAGDLSESGHASLPSATCRPSPSPLFPCSSSFLLLPALPHFPLSIFSMDRDHQGIRFNLLRRPELLDVGRIGTVRRRQELPRDGSRLPRLSWIGSASPDLTCARRHVRLCSGARVRVLYLVAVAPCASSAWLVDCVAIHVGRMKPPLLEPVRRLHPRGLEGAQRFGPASPLLASPSAPAGLGPWVRQPPCPCALLGRLDSARDIFFPRNVFFSY